MAVGEHQDSPHGLFKRRSGSSLRALIISVEQSRGVKFSTLNNFGLAETFWTTFKARPPLLREHCSVHYMRGAPEHAGNGGRCLRLRCPSPRPMPRALAQGRRPAPSSDPSLLSFVTGPRPACAPLPIAELNQAAFVNLPRSQ
jgi:hypothetical protein